MDQNKETQKQNNNHSTDEIDLKELFNAIGNFFKNIFLGIMYGILAIRKSTVKHFKLIAIFCVIGGAIGIILNFTLKEYYTSSMLLSSKYSSRKLIENSINKLDQLCTEQNYSGLSDVLKIDLKTAKNIQGFSYEPFVTEEEVVELEVLKEQLSNQIEEEEIIQKFVEKLKTDFTHTYRISVNVFNNNKIDTLENPLLNYFRDNNFVSKRIKAEKRTLKEEIEEIEEELSTIDSMKVLMLKNLDRYADSNDSKATNNIFLSDERWKDPMQVFNESQSLYRRKLQLESDLEVGDEFELIDGFTAYSKPESPGLLELGFFGGLYAIGFAYIIIILINFNRYLTALDKKRNS